MCLCSPAAIYFPRANLSKDIRVGMISGSRANAWWYNPRTGTTHARDGSPSATPFDTFPSDGNLKRSFSPPGSDAEEDWVLVLDDRARGFGAPGSP